VILYLSEFRTAKAKKAKKEEKTEGFGHKKPIAFEPLVRLAFAVNFLVCNAGQV
jgi:hypothetical protein